MAAGDINDALTDIPGITLRDDTDDPTDQGAGFALLKFKNGKLIWLPNAGAVRYALDSSSASQIAGLTEEASPADADLLLMERASDGLKRKVQYQNLPGGGTGGLYDAYLQYRDEKASGTNGGTNTATAWTTRVLNTEKADTAGIGSLASNEVTLPAGTYRVFAEAPFFTTGNTKLRIYNVTGAAVLVEGPMYNITATNQIDLASVKGRFTLGAQSAIRVEYYTQTSQPTVGLGGACSQGTEVYTDLELWRES